MSVAASFDPTPRTPDWYVELLIVFAIMVHKIAKTRRRQISVPRVVHILWTEISQPLLKPSLEVSDTAPGPASAPSTPKIHQRLLDPSFEPSGRNEPESSSSSTIQATKTTDPLSAPRLLETSDTPKSSNSAPTPPPLAAGYVLGSIAPSKSPYFDLLKQSRKDDIDQALRDLDPSRRDWVINKIKQIQDHSEKDNFGQCAETFPYLCIVSGGLNHRQIYGLAFESTKLDLKSAQAVLSAKPFNPIHCLHFLHYFGFIKACKVCCVLMKGLDVEYIQYRRKANLKPTLKYPHESDDDE
ncbi:hypothetical protein FRC01_005316 [Tulasnella sp. 417]|nr:hypothetical protein FRC01_005316 [Tulasnella sp. 417]